MKAAELTGNISSAIEFNKTKRFCGNHWQVPSYDMYEKRYCKGFELNLYMTDYYYDKKRTIMNLFTWIKTKLKHRKYKKFIQYYRSNPDKFCEEFLGMELFDYQRKILREMSRR